MCRSDGSLTSFSGVSVKISVAGFVSFVRIFYYCMKFRGGGSFREFTNINNNFYADD